MAALTRFLRSAAAATAALPARRALSTAAPPAGLAGVAARKDPAERGVQWVFLGCPGVGKGTYASRLTQLLGVPHIATGDLVREALSSSSPLATQLAEIVNQGKLVSDEIIINLLSKRLENGEAKGESGFILDGFPRTIRQASRPVEEFYRSRGKLMEFDLPGGIPESWPKLLQALNLEDYEEKQSAVA